MKYVRFNANGIEKYGVIEDRTIRVMHGNYFYGYHVTNQVFELSEVELLPPVLPSKIIAIGLNYKDHAQEMQFQIPEEPLIFLKPSTCVIGHEQSIIHPTMSNRIDYEGELAIVIGKITKNVSEETANDYILGATICNDVTARDLQKKDSQWTRAKGFDTFAPLGPWIVTGIDYNNLAIETRLNGKVVQSSNTSNMIYKPVQLVAHISKIMTLYPGDIIITGTPSGIGPMNKGDIIEIEIENIGTLRNYNQ